MSLKTRLIKLEAHRVAKAEHCQPNANLEATIQWLNDIIQQLYESRVESEKESHEL
jgi:hypothetical protein